MISISRLVLIHVTVRNEHVNSGVLLKGNDALTLIWPSLSCTYLSLVTIWSLSANNVSRGPHPNNVVIHFNGSCEFSSICCLFSYAD